MKNLIINAEKLVADKFDSETIIVDLGTGSYFSLRGAAVQIWDMLEQGTTLSLISESFSSLSDDNKTEISEFVSTLLTEGLVTDDAKESTNTNSSQSIEYVTISLEKFEDMQELILLDPIHEVDAKGWPHEKEK